MTETIPFQPDWVSAPGGTIEDVMEERGWTQAELADRLGFTRKHVNKLLSGDASITPDAASRLARVMGSSADFWLVREAQYRAALERADAMEALKADAGWLKELPVAWMAKQGLIKRLTHAGQQVAECLSFFGVASVPAWRKQYASPLVAFRSSSKFEKHAGAVAVWLRACERQATAIRCEPFDKLSFKNALHDAHKLTRSAEPTDFVPALVEMCARSGVAVLLAGHLLLHGKRLQFIEGLGGLDAEKEQEADHFSRDLLIPPGAAARLKLLASGGRISKATIEGFAQEIGVAPGIVVGRMQKEEWLPWTHHNDLKVRYTWGTQEA